LISLRWGGPRLRRAGLARGRRIASPRRRSRAVLRRSPPPRRRATRLRRYDPNSGRPRRPDCHEL